MSTKACNTDIVITTLITFDLKMYDEDCQIFLKINFTNFYIHRILLNK